MEKTPENDYSLSAHSTGPETGKPGREKPGESETVQPVDGKPSESDRDIEITKLDAESIKVLWSKTYNTEGKPDWSHILPYYHEDILFRDTIQELRGMKDFRAMTERLTERSRDLTMNIVRSAQNGNDIFIEWEMSIAFRKRPNSVLYGTSRVTLNEEGKIIEQRDYYDLWGDIFDNIPRFGKAYRRFMKRRFG